VRDFGETEVWAKTLSDGSAAVALLNAAATANNSTVILWTCSAAANQRWTRV
jgi:hypothetical protein